MSNLQMSLITKWFEMTKAGIKKEDYRKITPYWCSRFLLYKGRKETRLFWENKFYAVQNCDIKHFISKYQNIGIISFCKFEFNIMTLGYPKSTDTSKIFKLEHKGIEIRTGNPDWGAEPGKIYFVIKHGELLTD